MQVVDALRYKPDSREIVSRWGRWDFSLTLAFLPHYGPVVVSMSNRNK
jgi:hypothetical protein